MKKFLATSLLALGLMAGSGNAATILSLTGDETPDVLDGSYNPEDGPTGVGPGTPISVADSTLEGLLLDGPATVIFTYLGEEAGFNNLFRNIYLGDELLFTNADTYGETVVRLMAPNTFGFLPFKFVSNGPGDDVVNGGVVGDAVPLSTIGFFEILDFLPTLDHAVFLALFNDGGGPDSDYDDMVIRIEATRSFDSPTEVPLPAGLMLFLSGMVGLGFLGRARAKAA